MKSKYIIGLSFKDTIIEHLMKSGKPCETEEIYHALLPNPKWGERCSRLKIDQTLYQARKYHLNLRRTQPMWFWEN